MLSPRLRALALTAGLLPFAACASLLPPSSSDDTRPPSNPPEQGPTERSIEDPSINRSARERSVTAEIGSLSFASRGDGDGVVMRLHVTGEIREYDLVERGRHRARVILRGARLTAGLRSGASNGPITVREISERNGEVWIDLDLDGPMLVQAYQDGASYDFLVSTARGPDRMVLEMPYISPERLRAVRTENGVGPPVAVVSPTPSSREEGPRVRSTTTSPPMRSVAYADEASRSHWMLDTIVLDAGHGAHDYGTNHHGVREKEVVLAITRILGDMIEGELGVDVVYTRESDRFVELRERGRVANRSGGKLFISIHANAARNGSAYGTETYILAQRKSDQAREVLERENSVIQLESDPSLYEQFNDEGEIMQELTMSAYQYESQELARLIEREFVRSGRHSRGVKHGPFLVLWAASMPSVLIETGFVSNREESRMLGSREGQEATARAIFRAVREYKHLYDRGLSVARQ